MKEKEWGMILHLSLLAGYAIPLVGLVAPILIWQIKKDEFSSLDVHGKIVMNWMISSVIYWAVSIILSLLLIGIPVIILLSIVSIVFPVVGGIKANNGEFWKYPLSIPFLQYEIPAIASSENIATKEPTHQHEKMDSH